MIGFWAFNWRVDVGVMAFLVGVCGSVGMFLTKLLVGGEQYAKKAIKETQKEATESRERALDNLEKRLEADNDKRTEAALRDLRALETALHDLDETGAISLSPPAVVEIMADTAQLFDQCVVHLEKTLALWETAHQMRTKAARQPILDNREKILVEIFQCVREMGKTLVDVQQLGADSNGEKLASVRGELEQNLAVARQVDARIRDFEDEFKRDAPE